MLEIEALQLALSNEEAAIKLYNEFAVKHPGLKYLFYSMVTEEQKHKKWLEEKIAEMTR
jgi:rubrerythrin